MPEDTHEETLSVFHSVMAGHYDVHQVIGSPGSLLNGTADSHMPIRPFHASYYDFLTFVDTSVQSDLALASLRVLEHGLRFNAAILVTFMPIFSSRTSQNTFMIPRVDENTK
ncbi:hypothetical protein BDR04DRAFT_1229136 [Suillus decipiens]|nr:hypothetical protein BDR04DRAFT_1229136 [Suillus decipiens]